MDVYIVALFPEITRSFAGASIIGRAVQDGRVRVHEVPIRDFATGKHRTTDDTPCGGGSGMLMMAPPIVAALESLPEVRDDLPSSEVPRRRPWRILLTPQGKRFDQRDAERLAMKPALALVCGRYEGVDERIRSHVDEEISLGDFVLTGGEPAAVVLVDAIVRLLPGVLGNCASVQSESHGTEGLLEYPQYTRPVEFLGENVPAVLISGDHARVEHWRRWHALRRTRERRPDLFAQISLTPAELAWLDGPEP